MMASVENALEGEQMEEEIITRVNHMEIDQVTEERAWGHGNQARWDDLYDLLRPYRL